MFARVNIKCEILMLKKLLFMAVAVAIPASFLCIPVRAEDTEGSKYSTKVIMKTAFKGDLLKKVASGSASKEEQKKLHEMLVSLGKNPVKKGDAESWKKLTSALVKSSKAVLNGEENAGEMLKKAANCKACHNIHK